MDFVSLVSILAPTAICCVAIIAANQDEQQGRPFARSRGLMYFITAGLFGFALTLLPYVVLTPAELAAFSGTDTPVAVTSQANALSAFLISAVGAAFCLIVVGAPQSRRMIQVWIGQSAKFNPWSAVHIVAIILAIALMSTTVSQLILSGGLEGLAQQFGQQNDSLLTDVMLQQAVWILPSLLGVGLLTRRTWSASLERLGLRIPTRDDIFIGVGAAIAMLIFVFALGFIWSLVTDPETLAQQTAASAELSSAINTLPLAFVISLAVAVGEEIYFRGAMQPIFGIGLTSIFFTLLHTQYALTPASLAILVLSIVLGWVRQRYSTTASIITHLVYNFAQLALAILATNIVGGV